MIPRFKIGDTITIFWPEHNGYERLCKIVEVKVFPRTKTILYIYEYCLGHHRCIKEDKIDQNNRASHSDSSWTNY